MAEIIILCSLFSSIDNRFSCGGTVISPTVVLSAAHCTQGFTPAQIQVRLGCSFLNNCAMAINGVNQVNYK